MQKNDHPFTINFLDHVAIRVRDLESSASWYNAVLGLSRYDVEEWGPYPIFMLAGKTGVALFPLYESSESKDNGPLSIDHFAFNVNREGFENAQESFRRKNIDFVFQDHHFFHSIYLRDPDGHKVELTTLVVDESRFYKQ